jgi:hypothetical protein
MPANNAQSVKEKKDITMQFNRVIIVNRSDYIVYKYYRLNRAWNTTNFYKKHLKKCMKFQELLALEERRRLKAFTKSIGNFLSLLIPQQISYLPWLFILPLLIFPYSKYHSGKPFSKELVLLFLIAIN